MTSLQTEQVLDEKEAKSPINEMSDVVSNIKAAPEATNGTIDTGSEEKLQDGKDGVLDSDMAPSTAKKSNIRTRSRVSKASSPLKEVKVNLREKISKPGSSLSAGIRCEVCKKRFAARYHLNRHTMIHTGERPFPCDSCDMKFYRKDKLDKHKRTHKNSSKAISKNFKQPAGRGKPGRRRKV